ncbi:28605_t:CDS:2 [Gigaspora margarita]|uniref:28605_t:CDS:1 n=1 Tax=Gigaspora margarita TaxID=4874 RepID=A0ABN7VC31_GIGMA|nr:28605_t:CDS:2 [Gigaspora margarita]
MDEPDIDEPDINEPDINEPDINEPDITKSDINENKLLEKCTKCQKFLPINQFIKKNCTLKSCESCHRQSSDQYKASIEHDENEVLFPKEMAEELFNKISLVGSDKYFENDSDGINFKSITVLDDFKDKEDAKKPRKHQDPELQRDRELIECFDCSRTLRISINMITNNASIYLKHEVLYQ